MNPAPPVISTALLMTFVYLLPVDGMAEMTRVRGGGSVAAVR